jgi:uncharacterized coiled-coil DUF342 family protein
MKLTREECAELVWGFRDTVDAICDAVADLQNQLTLIGQELTELSKEAEELVDELDEEPKVPQGRKLDESEYSAIGR